MKTQNNIWETVSLNGAWDLAFDPENKGKEKAWFSRFPKSVEAQVPGVWEQVKPGYDGVGWYRKRFEVSESLCEGTLRLRFGAVHYYCEVWLNGERLGDHEGGGSPFEFDISREALSEKNELIVRVINPPMDREIEGFRAGAPMNQGVLPVGKAGWYYNYGGIWQDVELLATPKVYAKHLHIKPYPFKKRVNVRVTVINKSRAGSYELDCAVTPSGKTRTVLSETRTVQLRKGLNEILFSFAFKDFRWWSPDNPFLYTCTAKIAGDTLSDRFGMREFNIKNGHFVLNGKRITLKGYLQQGSYPRTLIFPDTEEMARKELRLVKESGCNFIRSHLKAPNPYWLDLCDEYGIMIEGEPGIGWIGKSPETERRCREEIEGLIQRDRNHPSIVFWCLMNEAYHFRGFTMAEIKRMTARLAKAARKLDDTRLLMDTSGGGGGADEGGDVVGGTQVLLPHVDEPGIMTDDHAYCSLPLSDASLVEYRTAGRKGLPLFISEYGAPLSPPNHRKVLNSYTPAEQTLGLEDYQLHKSFYDSLKEGFRKANLKGAFGTVDRFVEKVDRVRADEIRLITAAQRTNPTLAGTALCQLADASGELFGALDFFRNPKELYHRFSEAVQTPLPAVELLPRVSFEGDAVKIRFTLINEDQPDKTDEYRLEILNPSNKVIKKLAGEKIQGRGYIQTLHISTIKPGLPGGAYILRAKLLRKGRTFRTVDMAFTVLPKPEAELPMAAVFDPQGTLTANLKKLGARVELFSNNFRDKSAPVLMDMRQSRLPRYQREEIFQQLRKIAETGGVGILFNPEPLLLHEVLFPTPLRPSRTGRQLGYIKKHPIFKSLPSDCVADYVYADVFMDDFERGEDVLAAGGEVISGGLSAHMWTRPADYTWGAGIYTISVGRGEIIVCQMTVLDALDRSRTAQTLFVNLINYAAGRIKPGLEEQLLSRCIDPIDPRLLE